MTVIWVKYNLNSTASCEERTCTQQVLSYFTFFETRESQTDHPLLLSRANSHVFFPAEYNLGFTKCKDCCTKLDHLLIILLPTVDIRKRSTSLTHPQKIPEQSVAVKEVVKNNHRSIPQLDIVNAKWIVEYSICSTLLLYHCYYHEEYSKTKKLNTDGINLNSSL